MLDKTKIQKVFDKVATHLLTQKLSAQEYGGGNCYYRYHGLKCAIGALIPDEVYDSKIEGGSVAQQKVYELIPEELRPVPGDGGDMRCYSALQRIHDRMKVGSWPRWLYAYASAFELTIPDILDEALGTTKVTHGQISTMLWDLGLVAEEKAYQDKYRSEISNEQYPWGPLDIVTDLQLPHRPAAPVV